MFDLPSVSHQIKIATLLYLPPIIVIYNYKMLKYRAMVSGKLHYSNYFYVTHMTTNVQGVLVKTNVLCRLKCKIRVQEHFTRSVILVFTWPDTFYLDLVPSAASAVNTWIAYNKSRRHYHLKIPIFSTCGIELY